MTERLPDPFGTALNRDKVIEFRFEGRNYEGLAGDTIASALAANNQWLLSRSFKYHRPRGVLTMAGHDANTLVQLPGNPNVLADREPIRKDLVVFGQNYSGSLQRDRSAWIGRFAKFLPVGFYYKAFFKPKGIWEFWAKLIRNKAGLGVLDPSQPAGVFDKQCLFCDVVVIGAGPAGMTAALSAANAGASVLLVEENSTLGGSLNYARLDPEGSRSAELRQQLTTRIEAHGRINVLTDATCNGWFADNWVAIIQANRLLKLRAKQTIFCTGSLEQPAIFRNNDLPGVMLGSAAQRLLRLFGVRPGQRAVVLTGNDDGYGVALDLIDAGVKVEAILDMRNKPGYSDNAMALLQREVLVKTGHTVYAAQGKTHLTGVEVRQIISEGQCVAAGETIVCDLLCVSVGYAPAWQLPCLADGKLGYDDEHASFHLSGMSAGVQLAGSVAGHWDLADMLVHAEHAGAYASHAASGEDAGKPPLLESRGHSPNHPWPIFPHPKGKEFVDFDEDLQIADIINAAADGYDHIQLVKRYSTLGMGPSQGRHSALATARLIAKATGRSVAETGVTTARPPVAAELIGHNAGRGFYPARRSSMHYRHLEAGAQMLQAGAWYRPAYYGTKDQAQASINAEVVNVRNNVGLVDVSTLGGIEVRGPDAAEFLNRIYTFAFVKQPVGQARYALMTNEAGVVIDDGVACRLHEQHYYVTATSGGVDAVYRSMLKWNAQWRLDVDVANVTPAWCGVNLAGPHAREVLRRVCDDVELSPEAFPYMGVRTGHVAGIPARLIRVGFVGELGFEIHVPQHCGEALWDALIDAGQSRNIMPFGIEAQRVLRLEKGHIIIGQDTDAMSTPAEVQMGWAVARNKPFFVGGRTIDELDRKPPIRALVGFVVNDLRTAKVEESHLLIDGDDIGGRVTSCNYSPTLDRRIGLAYAPPAKAEPGSQIQIRVDGKLIHAEVLALPFYDPDTRRQEIG